MQEVYPDKCPDADMEAFTWALERCSREVLETCGSWGELFDGLTPWYSKPD